MGEKSNHKCFVAWERGLPRKFADCVLIKCSLEPFYVFVIKKIITFPTCWPSDDQRSDPKGYWWTSNGLCCCCSVLQLKALGVAWYIYISIYIYMHLYNDKMPSTGWEDCACDVVHPAYATVHWLNAFHSTADYVCDRCSPSICNCTLTKCTLQGENIMCVTVVHPVYAIVHWQNAFYSREDYVHDCCSLSICNCTLTNCIP